MATKESKEQVELAFNRGKDLLDTNNAASSRTSDKLLSILEAGESSSITRDLLDQFLDNMMTGSGSTTYSRIKLRQCLSIKEKIAYIGAYKYVDVSGIPVSNKNNIHDETLRNELYKIIKDIEDHLLKDRDFTESWILRNAALNNFACDLNTNEKVKLNNFTGKIKKLCTDNKLDNLAEATDFTQESDAQKIMKILDIISQLSASGIDISQDLTKEFSIFDEKIKPLKDLDKHFKHVTKTMNMLHRVAQKGYHSAIRPEQEVKFNKVVATLDMSKIYNEEIINFNKIENFDKNEEHTFLDNLLIKFQSHNKYKETLNTLGVSEAEFNEWLFSGTAFNLMNNAKLGLDGQKGIAFGERKPRFEKDTQSRRGLVRERLLNMPGKSGASPREFNSQADADIANSYFDKFKDIFFAKEEDNYQNGANALNYEKMKNILAAIIRKRVPALASSNRIRVGSTGRKIYKRVEHALKGTERGIGEYIRQKWHDANDAEVVAMVIMAQNEATNQVFYQDHNKAVKRDSRYGKLMNKISRAERGRDEIKKRISPTVNKALTFTEEAVKKGLGLTSRTAQRLNKVGSKTTRGTSRVLDKTTGAYNKMIKTGGYKRWKTPLYLPFLLTYPVEKVSELVNKGATYTDAHGNEHIKFAGEQVNKGYEQAKDLVAKGTGEDTKYLFQGLTHATDKVTEFAGNTISTTGKRFHDNYSTGQQRSILGAFYQAAKEEKGLADLMQSCELAGILNLQEEGPYLFDKDGRIVITQKVEKKDENDPEEVGKSIGKTISDNLPILLKQADEAIKKKMEEEEKLYNSSEDQDKKDRKLQRITKEIESANEQKTIIKDIHDEITNIVPILNKPILLDKWKDGDVKTAIDKIRNKCENGGKTGYIDILNKEIGSATTGLTKDLIDAETDKKTAEQEIKTQKSIFESNNRTSQTKGLSPTDIKDAINNAGKANDEIIKQEGILNRRNEIIDRVRLEIRNKKALLSRLQKIYNQFENLNTINTGIGNNAPTTEQIEKLKNFKKNLDLLLHPEEDKKDTKTLNLNDYSKEKQEEIAKILGA